MKKPYKPQRPTKPIPPLKNIKTTQNGSCIEGSYITIQELMNKVPAGTGLNDVSIRIDSERGFDGDIYTSVYVDYCIERENPNYNNQYEAYEKNLKLYFKKVEEYKPKLTEYLKAKEEYDVWFKIHDEKNKKHKIELKNLRKRVVQLEKKLKNA